MRASGGSRIEWTDLPVSVRRAVEVLVGTDVVRADNQTGGFSPGLAARCQLADGRRIFLKAVSPDQNRQSCRIHRREAEIAALLPASVPAPRLLHVHDDGHWVVLAFEDIDADQPTEPWTLDALDHVIPALTRFSETATPSPVAGLQSVVDRHRPVFSGWRRLAEGDGDVARLHPWAREHVDRLAEIEPAWEGACAGDTLVHADLRADNLLVDRDGVVWIVDWPWACVGAPFVDLLFMLPSIGMGGGPRPPEVIERFGLFADVDADSVIAVAVAVSGFFARSALDPPPPGLPRLRDFQRAQADVAIEWLETLLPET